MVELESLEADVRDESSRTMFGEVIRAYRVGAFRSALVSLWITVVVDLTGKIRYLAETGDGAAQQKIDDLDRWVEGNQVRKVNEFENSIINTAGKELGILTSREVKEMKRLFEDRHLCAHPSFSGSGGLFHPDAELVRSHLMAAFRGILSQPPIAGKRRIQLLETELESEGWPKGDGAELRRYLRQRFFQNARESVQKNMMKILVKKSLNGVEEDDSVAQRCGQSVQALVEDYPALCEETLAGVLESWEVVGSLSNERLFRAVGIYGGWGAFWGHLPETARTRLASLLEEPDLEALLVCRLFACGRPSDGEIAVQFDKALRRLNSLQFQSVLMTTTNREAFVGTLIEAIGAAYSFRAAEAWVKLLVSCAEELSEDEIAWLGDVSVDNDQVVYAANTERLFLDMYESSSNTEAKKVAWRELAEKMSSAGQDVKFGSDYEYSALVTAVRA